MVTRPPTLSAVPATWTPPPTLVPMTLITATSSVATTAAVVCQASAGIPDGAGTSNAK